MRLRIFTNSIAAILLLCGWCLSNETSFISINGDCRYPVVAAEGDTLYLAWLGVVGGDAGIFFRKSVDGGAGWSVDRRLSVDGSSCYPPAIAVRAGVVHAAWVDYNERMDGELYYSRSLDGGATWEKGRILVDEANSARYPLLACKDDHVYMIWQDVENKTYFKASHDKGQTWGTTTTLASLSKHSCYCYPPALCVTKKEVSVVWTDVREKTGLHVFFKGFPLYKSGAGKMVSAVVRRKSIDGGNSWGSEQILAKTEVAAETKAEIDNPALLSDDTLSYMFWLDKSNIKLGEIVYAKMNLKKDRFPIAGKTLFPPEKRSPKRPAVVVDKEKRFNLVWTTFLGGMSVVNYCRTDADGNLVEPKKELTSDTVRYHNPSIALTGSGTMHVFWFDEPKDAFSKIYLKTSRDNGRTWEAWGSPRKEL
jgi:hypothetical protein